MEKTFSARALYIETGLASGVDNFPVGTYVIFQRYKNMSN